MLLPTNCGGKKRCPVQPVVYVTEFNAMTSAADGRGAEAIGLVGEPDSLQRKLIEIRPTGRTLTPAGVECACLLTGGK
jgi:hypothetical protein